MPAKVTEERECRVPFKIVEGGVTAAKGFRASAVTCGIKNPEATRLDLALIVSDSPTVTDAVFTTNKVRAGCVRVCQQHIKESDTRAIIANSGTVTSGGAITLVDQPITWSPENSAFSCGNAKQRWLEVCPGVATASIVQPSPDSKAPSANTSSGR